MEKKSEISNFFGTIGNEFKTIGTTFVKGDWKTKISYLILGFGPLLRGKIVYGLALLLSQIAFFAYFFGFGINYLKDITTLGTHARGWNPDGTVSYGDNSFLILLFSILTIFFIIFYIVLWVVNIHENAREEATLALGKKLRSNEDDVKSLLDENFDKVLLALPMLGIFVFTVLPIVFMVCIAFTNYDYDHQAPSRLFTWVGFENFKTLLSFGGNGFGKTFFTVLGWTLLWAFFATFLNYFIGMAVAMLINQKGIKFKKMWRTILVLTIAVPQFVSLLYVYKMFASDGLVNAYLNKLHIITFLSNLHIGAINIGGWLQQIGIINGNYIAFWAQPTLAKITIIIVNLWIGIPYLMLIATGLLMNIPEDLYESARIDGANAFQMFFKITLPYMLFVTGPYLLTNFTGNLNNFNVIYLLTQGKPQSMSLSGNAGHTDLLVTWLYKMTVNDTNYKMAAVIGIMVFIVTAVISLIVYNLLPSVKDEEGFQ